MVLDIHIEFTDVEEMRTLAADVSQSETEGKNLERKRGISR